MTFDARKKMQMMDPRHQDRLVANLKHADLGSEYFLRIIAERGIEEGIEVLRNVITAEWHKTARDIDKER